MKLLMITGDRSLAQGKKGPFYYMLEEFSQYWERIDIICPRILRTSNIKPLTKIFENVYIHSSQKSLISQPWFILKKGKEIFKQQKFDLFTIHSYPPFYNDIGGLWLYNKLRTSNPEPINYVLEIMHVTGYPKAGNFKEWLYKILTRLFIKKFTRKAKAVRVINQIQVSEFLIKSKVDEEKIKYIPAFYIDFETFKPVDMSKPRTKTDLVRGKYDIVFSGRLVKNKGIELLLEAIKKIKNSPPEAGQPWAENIKLAITGSGPLEEKIKSYIKNNHLEKNIEFIGWVEGTKELAEIYNQSKMMVIPSFNEGGPRVALEAMACNVPVLTSRVGIMLDIVNDPSTRSGQVNGMFIDWKVEDIANKIMLLLKDDSLRNKIAENGYKTIQQFERKKVIENYALTYQGLVDSDNN